jgi:hypothetical protein
MTWKRSFLDTSSCWMTQNDLSIWWHNHCAQVCENVFHRVMNKTWSLRRVGSERPSIGSLYNLSRPRHRSYRIAGVTLCRLSVGALMSLSISITSLSRSLWHNSFEWHTSCLLFGLLLLFVAIVNSFHTTKNLAFRGLSPLVLQTATLLLCLPLFRPYHRSVSWEDLIQKW